ncbi:twin transmembrane helix small protein [Pseudomonas stutzeri]|uniref:twin transmembrane helix small protein n=1 Tax=Stutzerimonas stutzeri TaxID=316 RepID=UPI00210CB886|nr:twin transmembrane helix small protein [Stutzerimonas stutzeri]MCQ4312193.1 twin transmembrane helix small protein [Stutzerimonas stutzeri]
MLKAAIVLLLVATLVSLFSGLFFLVKDEGRSSRMVTALFVRVSLSALTIALIAWGFYTGQLQPGFG